MSKWDEKYANAPDGLFGNEPNLYLTAIAGRRDFKARSGLCLADGDGRNSRWLALQGLAMTAVDLSAVACANGRLLDAAAGVSIERIAADLGSWTPSAETRFEAVFLFYLQAPSSVRRAALRTGWQALAPGGWFLCEGFAKTSAEDGCGPLGPDLRYDLAEIKGELSDAVIVEALSGEVRLDEGGRHQGLGQVVRFAARKNE